jgi:hypothetical protein
MDPGDKPRDDTSAPNRNAIGGMAEMSRKFREMGGEVYVDADAAGKK